MFNFCTLCCERPHHSKWFSAYVHIIWNLHLTFRQSLKMLVVRSETSTPSLICFPVHLSAVCTSFYGWLFRGVRWGQPWHHRCPHQQWADGKVTGFMRKLWANNDHVQSNFTFCDHWVTMDCVVIFVTNMKHRDYLSSAVFHLSLQYLPWSCMMGWRGRPFPTSDSVSVFFDGNSFHGDVSSREEREILSSTKQCFSVSLS